MRKNHGLWVSALAALSLLLGVGCYRNTAATPSTTHRQLRFEDALARAYRGDRGPWWVQGLHIEPLGGGAVRVTRGHVYESRVPVRGASNGWITTKVRSKLATTRGVESRALHVDTNEDGVVLLRGTVAGPRVASYAIEQALDTTGVNAVDSYLRW